MEDADPSLTRKRPRLDSGSKDTLAMPHEQTPASTTSTTSASAAPPREQQVEMTIRLQPPSSSHAMDAADDATAALATTTAAAAAALREDLSPETVADSTEIDFVDAADGSADSPPVIAIDDDDDSDPMIAGTLSSAAEIDYTAELSFQRFPFAQNGHYIQALQTIAQHFREGTYLQLKPTTNGLVC
jgi:ubiquitin carboxyl-terminal hydrolase 34